MYAIQNVPKPMARRCARLCGAYLLVLMAVPATAGPREEFAKLESEMEIAAEEYNDAVRRRIVSERTGKADPDAAPPVDRRPEILRKMDALADAARALPEGGYLAVKTYLWAVHADVRGARARFERASRLFPDEPLMEDAAISAMELHHRSGPPDAWITDLLQLAETTRRESTRQAALFAAGRVYVMIERPADAKAAFARLLNGSGRSAAPVGSNAADDPPPAAPTDKDESEYVILAKGELFELENLQVGMVAPPFTTTTIEGREVSLASLRGKVVLLKFWASWCVPCLVEIPTLKEAAVELAGSPFEMLAVSVDRERQALLNALETMHPPGIQTWDLKGADNPVAALYNVQQYPTSFLLDADGVIRARRVPADQLVEMVKAILPKKPGREDHRDP